MNNLKIGKAETTVKGAWSELSPDQVGRLVHVGETPEGRLSALIELLPKKGKRLLYMLDDEQLHQAATELTRFLFLPLTVQTIPALLIDGRVLRGVTSHLADMRFIEFIKAEALLPDLANSIDRLCALLYRYEGEGPFDDGEWAEKAKMFAQVPPQKKFAIARFYTDCREEIIQKYSKTIFKKGGGGKGASWGQVFHEMIEKPADVESLANEPLHNVLIYLSKERK